MTQPGWSQKDREFMAQALGLARHAAAQGEVPVGAVLVGPAGEVLAQAGNATIAQGDPTAHAEMLCLRQGARTLGNYRLTGCTLYVSLEPCPMCAGAVVWARLERVVFAAYDPKAGAYGSALDLGTVTSLNHQPLVQGGLLAEEAADILREFFAARR
ncbi:MAG: tRNA adenosine(34) deaminase TadA [Desulfarculaceae bacterium]|nr:tRNA adenosine(34) deaminase TadA [Desulfarculaceae bacterium]MCF8048166.1 tRNA adenosine(34) deaminase TadA [Desulfarculaceae bacterium]MCF8065958.1 tRNA adenosine(34) deaminase TadA [Desulfarculaceae bacterium]MCF8098811.1 tRNA adenosine(34) deaminase TadA [Desulfarculaceae bacterium]MCF8123553.1 tRNA adenosine(34) deaminase TadA [Desulfarculaceae bacterium]